MLPDNTICTSNSNKESAPPCPIFLGLPGLCAEHCGQSITLQSYRNTEYRAVREHGCTFTSEYSVVGVHNLPPRSHEHFLLSPRAVRDISGSAVSVSVTVSAVSLCARQPWDGLCCRLLPPHKMASPAALHTGPSHWKCCCAGKMSCLVALQGTLLQIEEGDGFLTGMLASLHSPSGVASPAAAPRALQTASPPRAPSSKGRCAQGLCASTDIPCQRPRGHCRGLQARAHKPGTTAQPHCPELGGSWHLGRHQHPAQSAQKQEDKNSPNKAWQKPKRAEMGPKLKVPLCTWWSPAGKMV